MFVPGSSVAISQRACDALRLAGTMRQLTKTLPFTQAQDISSIISHIESAATSVVQSVTSVIGTGTETTPTGTGTETTLTETGTETTLTETGTETTPTGTVVTETPTGTTTIETSPTGTAGGATTTTPSNPGSYQTAAVGLGALFGGAAIMVNL